MRRVALGLGVALASCGAPPAPPPPIVVATPPLPPDAAAPIVIAVPPPEVPIVAKPEAPAPEPFDPNLVAESWTFLGASETHAWFHALGMNDPQPRYSIVVDLAKGCVVESYKDTSIVEDLARGGRFEENGPPHDTRIRALIESRAAEIRRIVGLANRFGLRTFEHGAIAWNAEGPDVLVAAGLLYHSRDGGRTFQPVDAHLSREVAITADGTTAVYERCNKPESSSGYPDCTGEIERVAWRLDGKHPPVVVGKAADLHARYEGLSKDGHVLTWKTDKTGGCLSFVSTQTGATDRTVCVKDPRFANLVKLEGLSPDETYAALDWQGFTRTHLTYETAIVELATSKIVRVLPEWQFRGIDDDGTVFVQPWAEGAGNSVYRFTLGKPQKQLVVQGGFMSAWEPKRKRAIIESGTPYKKTKLGKVACSLVRVLKT